MIPLTADQMALNNATAQARSDAVAAAICAAVPAASGLTVLDYGCGPGDIGLRLTDHFTRVVLADSDSEAIARALAAARDVPNAEAVHLDLTKDALPTRIHADVVVSCLSWHHIRHLDALLDALPGIAAGGRLFVADMDCDDGAYHAEIPDFDGVNGFDRPGLMAQIARHGYRDVAIRDLWKGNKWVAGVLTTLSLFLLEARIP